MEEKQYLFSNIGCLPSMCSIVARHNPKVLKKSGTTQPKPKATCNCQKEEDCPVPGEYNPDGAIYQTTVSSAGGRGGKYVGLANKFKKRYPITRKHYYMSLQRVKLPCQK